MIGSYIECQVLNLSNEFKFYVPSCEIWQCLNYCVKYIGYFYIWKKDSFIFEKKDIQCIWIFFVFFFNLNIFFLILEKNN